MWVQLPMRISRLLCIFFCCWICGQPLLRAQADPAETLLNIRRKVARSISRLPNYLCTETVERRTLAPDLLGFAHNPRRCDQVIAVAAKSPGKLVSIDRLRLDVAISSGMEMYSWVGEGHFDDRSLSEIVKQGATSTGAFSSFLAAIFASDSAEFTFKGKSQAEGRDILEYTFVVPLARSGYMVSNQNANHLTGYTGVFTADAKTLDLLRLEIHTDPLPPDLQVCQSSTIMDYTQVRISAADVLLPSAVDVRMLGTNGNESHNHTVFSGCHQFMGESKLIFDDQSTVETPASAAAKAKSIVLPPGLGVELALTQPIDPTTAAAGDLIYGRLTHPIKDADSGLIIPKGTKVNGRIFELLSYFNYVRDLELSLKWESIEVDGVTHPLRLAVKFAIPGSSKLPLLHGHWPDIRTMSAPEQQDVGLFYFPHVLKDYKIPVGFESDWTTLAPSGK